MTLDTRDTNAAYERAMREQGKDRWDHKHLEATEATDSPHHFNKLKEALPKVAEGIQKSLKSAKATKGRVPMWVQELSQVDSSTLAYIGLLCSFNGVLKTESVTQVTQKIGELVEKELLKKDLMLDDKARHKAAIEQAEALGLERPKPINTNKRLIDQVTAAHTSPRYRLKALRIIAEKNGTRSLNFGIAKTRAERQALKERRAKLAAPVLSNVLEFSEVFDKTLVVEGMNNTSLKLSFTEEAQEQLEKSQRYLSWMAPIFKPMLAEPKPWTDFDTGCYHDDFLASSVKLVRGASPEQEAAIRYAFTQGTPTYVKAANALQATPLSINHGILEAVQWCWDEQKQFGKFPTSRLPERPRLPENWQTLEREVIAELKADIRRHQKLESQVKGAAEVMRQDLQTAHELAVHDKFYLPVYMDFRGRLYFVPSFNYHRDDHIKALFTYYRGYRVEGNNEFWLKVHLANVGDFDKVSKRPLDERVQWVEDNMGWLMEVAQDFRSTFDLWSKADKPFQFLAAVFELKRLIDEGEDFVCYIPIALDGTNSGVQHYSGINRSETEGALVNLVPSEEMADIYRTNAERVVEVLKSKLEDHTPFNVKRERGGKTVAELAQTWLDYGVTRSVLKRSVMTFGYSSKPIGMSAQFVEDIMQPLQRKVAYGEIDKHPLGATEDEQFEAARFMAEVSYNAIQDVLPKVSEAMEYLQTVTEALARENKPIRWTSPSGFPIVQDYKKTKRKEIKIFLYDRAIKDRTRTKMSLREELDQSDVKKATNGIAPNLIHGCDSGHMHLTIVKMLEEGTAEDFFMIHDSFSISGDTWDLFDTVRHTFVDMYNGPCVFEKFENEIRQQLSNPAHDFGKTIPSKGNLNLEDIKLSQFCFS